MNLLLLEQPRPKSSRIPQGLIHEATPSLVVTAALNNNLQTEKVLTIAEHQCCDGKAVRARCTKGFLLWRQYVRRGPPLPCISLRFVQIRPATAKAKFPHLRTAHEIMLQACVQVQEAPLPPCLPLMQSLFREPVKTVHVHGVTFGRQRPSCQHPVPCLLQCFWVTVLQFTFRDDLGCKVHK
jgi:hypothetical protein